MAEDINMREPVSPQTPSSPSYAVRLRRPPQLSPFSRNLQSPLQSPSTPDSPSHSTPIRRQRRPTIFQGSNEFRPLYLVETHCKLPQPEPDEALPSLPSSRASSPGSSTRDSSDAHDALSDTSDPFKSHDQGSSPLTIYEQQTFQQISSGIAALNFEDKAPLVTPQEGMGAMQQMFVFGHAGRDTPAVSFQPEQTTKSLTADFDFVTAAMKAATLNAEENHVDPFAPARESMQEQQCETFAAHNKSAQYPQTPAPRGRALASAKPASRRNEQEEVSHESSTGNWWDRELKRERRLNPDHFRPLVLMPRPSYRDYKTPAELIAEAEEREWIEMSNADY